MPYWRLSLFYFFYFASLGAFMAYWGLYLKQSGISNFTIGALLAVFVGTRTFSPLVLAWVVDKTKNTVLAIKISSVLMLLSFLGLLFTDNLAYIFFWIFLFGFFFSGILPKFEALTFSYIMGESNKYNIIRLWGSVGFAFAVLLVGEFLEQTTIDWLLWVLVFFLLSLVVVSFSLKPITINTDTDNLESFSKILFSPKVKVFLLTAFLMQLSHGAYYSFFSIYLQEFDYSKSQIGILWAVGVAAEIVLFVYLSRFIDLFSKHKLIMISLLAAVVRWGATAVFAQNIWILVLVQLLHAATFALFHAVAIQYINIIFTRQVQVRGQAIYSMASFGIGGMLGSLLAGIGWHYLGGDVIFLLSAFTATIAVFIWHKLADL